MTSATTQCPFIDNTIVADNTYNQKKEYPCSDGSIYTYYYHFDGFDQHYNCQFCKLIGRKKDVFECLNENEWNQCSYYKGHKK
jgi:hypothetical protein